ncbi:MORC family CW-type zinc finger protein 1-like [Sceloporus undulatus]|uniref:MORC family CW-type zinc finger protein 1-like n=1 Tax=Sceloporus undulatus TaxID=8520 RepID=UPI001C4CB31D|nr:MORC family CW-type zinc finger protein 1-like [Sceloporus undulatus]
MMSEESQQPYGSLCRAELRLEYLHANSTTHDFLFGAVAELIDNSRDAGATRLDILTVDNVNLQGGFTLCFLDDGCGMTPHPLAPGMGAADVSAVVVPIPSWSSNTRKPMDDSEKFATQVSIIYKYSPFKNEKELMKQFDGIYGKTGTLLVIYNLKLTISGEAELDIQTDQMDILITESTEILPEQWSLRAYITILYFDPRMRIFIQGKKVETKRLPYCFYRPRMYPYISSSFKQVAINELRKTELEVKAAEEAVKEAKCTVKYLQDSPFCEDSEYAQLALQDAQEKEKRMKEKLEEKQRNLKRPKKLFLIFGINIQNRSQDGMLIYSNNRLIRFFEKVGTQTNMGSYFGAGAVGIVDVPLEVMEPTHNKQAFANVKEYNHLLKAMGNCLVQYWKDIGISQKGEALFWNDFGYLSDKWCERPSDTIQYKRRRAVEIPDIVQCDICLKWRLLSLDTDVNHGGHHGIWKCSDSPNPLEKKCDAPEHLPSIPLGTFNLTKSLDEKQKLLIASIQERKRKLENLQSQKLHLIEPHTAAVKSPKYKTAYQRKISNKDPSPACRHLIKNRTNKGHVQHRSHQKQSPAKQKPHSERSQQPCQKEKYFLSVLEERNDHSLPTVLPFEIQDEQSYNEEPLIIKVESDSEPEIISFILSDSEAEDLSKYEDSKDVSFMQKVFDPHEEEQEYSGEKGDSHLSLMSSLPLEENFTKTVWEGCSTEASKETNKEPVLVAVEESAAGSSRTQEDSEHIPKTKMIETLTSRIKEVLLYFLPECSNSREHLTSMCPEDILSMFKWYFIHSLDFTIALSTWKILLNEHWEKNKAVTLYIDEYFLQYEQQLNKKLQSETVRGIETETNLCKRQVKAAEEKLEHLRKKVAQLLLKIHPHLLINKLEDIDSFLEENLNSENRCTVATGKVNTSETSVSVLQDEDIEKNF